MASADSLDRIRNLDEKLLRHEGVSPLQHRQTKLTHSKPPNTLTILSAYVSLQIQDFKQEEGQHWHSILTWGAVHTNISIY